MTENVAEWKKNEVSEISSKIRESDVIGIVDIEGIPARQLQEMRANLRGKADLKVSRNTLLRIALNEAGVDEEFKKYIKDQAALLFSDINSFELNRIIEENKTRAPASAGDIAPSDIEVEEGPTQLQPGPVLGDLQKAGIPAEIDGGDVVIKENKVVKEEGEEIDALLADMLSKLGIEPIEVGLELKATQEDGVIFEPEALEIDEEEYRDKVVRAYQDTLKLSIEASYPTEETIGKLIQKAKTDSVKLGYEAEVLEPDILKDIISDAKKKAGSLASSLGSDFETNENE
ncbi:MAG: Ribosomal protein L10 [Candidatus Methanohalarchaeum thermophilum]|uniref:Large ribosomal subunit protein uL10 n=1 Tax=Methanohalarchaeum thermophilum TaxID=1903181 RepID=A0A1Q6DTB9_METT1|nr:MAG: Ribosomal protein L10 [Candidatus Methanohalarchaeum thermophilum]